MKKIERIAGRSREKAILQQLTESADAELLAVYGRRRVGKTYLITRYFGTFTVELMRQTAGTEDYNFDIFIKGFYRSANRSPQVKAAFGGGHGVLFTIDSDRDYLHVPVVIARPHQL